MSEAAAERPTRTSPPSSSGAPGNVFTRKFGPLPGWGWAALAGVGAIVYMWWRNKQGANAAAAASTPDTTGAVGDDVQGQLATIQTEIQDLQGEQSTDTDKDNDGSSGGGVNPGGPDRGGKTRRTRHVSDGKRSLNEIARSDHTSVADIVSASEAAHETEPRLDKLQAWARHPRTRCRGVVYWT